MNLDSNPSSGGKLSPAEKVRHLLDSAPAPEYQSEWTQFYATEKKAAPPVLHSVVIFRLGNEWLALATNVFQEIAERAPIHTLPHRKKHLVLGMVRVRGELLICTSVAAVLNIETAAHTDAANRTARFIVINNNGSRFVFPADEVSGIHRLSDELSPAPATVAHATAAYTKGLFQWQNKTVGCLDDQLLFHTLNRSLS